MTQQNISKLNKRLLHLVGKAIGDYGMIRDGDRIMLAISGGKDSWCMLHVLQQLQRRSPVKFELIAVHIAQSLDDTHADQIEAYLDSQSMIHRVVRRNIAALIDLKLQPGDIRCSLCSRLRRGVLYNTAEELQCTKIALGHHRDDLIETLLMNLFFNGRISSMPPVLKSDDQRNTVIRPLCYVPEEDLIAMINALSYPIFHCFNCASINGQRAKIKKLLVELEKENPTIKQTLLRSLGKVNPSHLMDRELWSF